MPTSSQQMKQIQFYKNTFITQFLMLAVYRAVTNTTYSVFNEVFYFLPPVYNG